MIQSSTSEQPYKMSISLNVLNHLGIGLYSNIPAVLSEVVANAWDADATEVEIIIKDSTITIQDNGIGMTKSDINGKYLTVGYKKRINEPGKTKKGRAPMGRKGIGKLSVFSIANIVEVYSIKDGERNGLLMNASNIETLMKDGITSDYQPEPIEVPESIKEGTTIILREIKKEMNVTEVFLRKRLARRFSIIGNEFEFNVKINGSEITPKDRDFFDNIEFMWYFGNDVQNIQSKCSNLRKFQTLPNTINDQRNIYSVRGWIGTVDEQRHIDDQNNSIVIFAHGKLIQEDILKDFKEGGIYSKYIIGEIDADFMDLDDQDDIVTSDRQRVKEDDPRYILLKNFIQGALKTIQNQWTNLRRDLGTERAISNIFINNWYQALRGDNKKYAEKLFGKIESLKIPDQTAKRELYKASILAFERLALNNALSILDKLETEQDFSIITNLFTSIDDLEAAHYYQIVKGRIEIVKAFQSILPASRERVLQQYIFEHLWLLDPSWERASSNFRIEESVVTEFNNINANLTQDEKAGRIDIRYKTAAGKHIIIELKKYNRIVTVTELLEQVMKYKSALEKCLREKYPKESRVIECICIIGSAPEPKGEELQNINILKAINARYITYDDLIQQTLESYSEYLKKESSISNIIRLLNDIESNLI